METKLCRKCHLELTAEKFYRKKDGHLDSWCRQCSTANMRERRKRPEVREAERAAHARYRASEKGKAKRQAWRNSEAGKASQRRYYQSEKGKAAIFRHNNSDAARQRRNRHYHSGKGRISNLRYQHTQKGRENLLRGVHKRRMLIRRESTLTASQWEAIKRVFGQACAYCGRTDRPLTRDHIIPLSRGGAHTAENVIPACRPCNSRKGNRLVSVSAPIRDSISDGTRPKQLALPLLLDS